MDGSSKTAIVKIDSEFNIVAYKAPDGEIKKKYTINIVNMRDWQFGYKKDSRQWKLSVFAKN